MRLSFTKKLRGYKKMLLMRVHHVVLLLFIAYAVLLPQQFSIDYSGRGGDVVLATYEDLLHQAQQQDGAISFEKMLVGGDEQTQITYIVQPGDNLSQIAKNFGTTVDAIIHINKMGGGSMVHPGQRLTIAYEENVLFEVKEPTTINKLATKHNLSVDDLLTLNYLDDAEAPLDQGQQLFLPMSRREAEKQGLIDKERFEMLDLPTPAVEVDEVPVEAVAIIEEEEELPEPTDPIYAPVDPADMQQVVISAEETQKHLDELKQGGAKEQHEENTDANKPTEQKKEEDKPTPAQPSVKNTDTKAPVAATCGENKCLFDNKCYSKPSHAVCANDTKQAWVCEAGFTDTGKSCVKPSETPKKKTSTKKASTGTSNQRYFNPRKAGFPGYGWGAGHCTEYAAYYWWKTYNINLRQYISGNAGSWYSSAQKGGLKTGQSPQIGSIVVLKHGASGWSGYGHVGIVTEINSASGQIKIQDANYVGRFIVSDHWIDSEDGVVGYIYP